MKVLLILGSLCFLSVNILLPLFYRKPDPTYADQIAETEFESDTSGKERILCIDDNEEALLWRLRMIGSAKKSIVLATFDLRPDENGTKLMAAIYEAANRGVGVRLLIDGIYEPVFLRRNDLFRTLSAHENIEVKIYNPIAISNLFRLNYRMHDKYLIVDDRMYLLGGRNSNDIFLGDQTTGINVDRDILVYDTSAGSGESLLELQDYFEQIWGEACVRETQVKPDKISADILEASIEQFLKCYGELKEKYPDLEQYQEWEEATSAADKITLISNGTNPGRKSPQVLCTIEYLAVGGEDVLIQTPYVICNRFMYDVLHQIAENAELRIILNAVEKGSNPWGCTDYLNHREDILDTGAEVYELMNEHAVHTKTVLVDDHISIVGSYNLDLRSTYLDTELMLVIDSEELNEHIRGMSETYMEKSKAIYSDGTEEEGPLYQEKELRTKKKLIYQVLRVLTRPVRHLL
ncbi:MAG: phosphatidylserine/phosphatidylglycerophosphate/cardiolipin synthase family protein [Fusicatenibacter sp.]